MIATIEISDDQVKKTVLSWYMVLSVCFLWWGAAIGGIFIGIYSFSQDDGVSMYSVFGFSFGLLHLLLLYCALACKEWGRILCLAFCILYVPFIPLGTLIGITGYIGFRDTKSIYVGNRTVLTELKQRYKQLNA